MINVSVDTETTGLTAGVHEVIQFAIVVLDDKLVPTGDRFVSNVRPQRPEVADSEALACNGIDLDFLVKHAPPLSVVKGSLWSWKSELFEEKFIPLFHNAVFDIPFLKLMLGNLYGDIFHYHSKDSMVLAYALRDAGKLSFESASLGKLSKGLGIVNEKAHSAYGDALTCAAVYRELLKRV